MKKARLLITTLMLFAAALYAGAQNISVSGTVIDAGNGEPVVGATVQLKGSATKYSITDLDGRYSLSAVPSNGTLVVTLIGFKTAEFPINGRAQLDLPLSVDTEVLEDAIIVGYGSAKKISAITGSAATVGAKLLQNAPVASVGDALQGQVAGLQVWSNSGEPSATISMRIRGVNSISADTEPLFILDGSPVPASIFSALNANDIENITVMKDASATSIYGSRAANGVVFITTKAGRSSEKPVFTVRAQYGVSNIVNHNIPLMNSEQWFDFNEMMDPTFLDKPGRAAQKDFALDHNINTNWVDYFFKPHAPTWQADATFSGGTSKTDYYVSLGALTQEGNAPYSDMSRISFMSKLNAQLNDWIKTGFSMNLTYQDVNTTGFSGSNYRNSVYNPMFMASQMYPWMLPYEYTVNADGSLTLGEERTYFDEMKMYNTYYLQKIKPSSTNYIRLSGNLYEQFTPVKGLTLRAVQALNGNDRRISQKANPVGPFEGAGTAGESFSRYYQMTFTNTAEYEFDFAEKNNINILLGQESILSTTNAFGTSVKGITDIRQEEINYGTGYNKPSWSKSEEVFNSYFSRIGYNHDGKYLVDASFRRDGSSLFGKNRRYANFWSLGARWNITKEEWLSNIPWLNNLSVKASYGTTGNSSIDNYLAFGIVGAYGSLYNGKAAWGLSSPSNDDLTWEVVENFNVGVSTKLFNSLSIDVDFYNKVTKDMLMEIPYSLTTGHDSGWGNVADMLNRGVDFELSYDVPMPQDFYLNLSANFNYNRNEITKLFDGRDSFEISGTGLKLEVGKPYGEFFSVRNAGVDPRDGMQMYYDTEGNKTKTFSDDYAVFTGKQMFAPWAGGFNFTFGWKGLSIGAQFSWVAGKYTFNNDKFFLMNPLFVTDGNGAAELLNMWTTPGQITDVPCLESERKLGNDIWLEDASFLRLKNLQCAYTLPRNLVRKIGFIDNVKVFVVGRNLLTFTKYTGYDPESASNLQLGRYPNSKQFTFGAEINF